MTNQTAHGRYLISSMERGGRWQARAFRKMRNGKRVVAGRMIEAESEQAAIASVKAELDEARAARLVARGTSGLPAAAEYLSALNIISVTEGQVAMLMAHYLAPERTMTATHLAHAAGYKNWSSANSQYGLLARNIAEEAEWDPPVHRGAPVWTFALAAQGEPDSLGSDLDEEHWRWKMHAQLAEAVEVWRLNGRTV